MDDVYKVIIAQKIADLAARKGLTFDDYTASISTDHMSRKATLEIGEMDSRSFHSEQAVDDHLKNNKLNKLAAVLGTKVEFSSLHNARRGAQSSVELKITKGFQELSNFLDEALAKTPKPLRDRI